MSRVSRIKPGKTITITGVDQSIHLQEFRATLDLSDEFPFVEWGILLSESRAGTPRYMPHEMLIGRIAIAATCGKRPSPRFAVHACGRMARQIVEEGERLLLLRGFWQIMSIACRSLSSWPRLQMNGIPTTPAAWMQEPILGNLMGKWILQAKTVDEVKALAGASLPNGKPLGAHADVLFDPSGGRGVSAIGEIRELAAWVAKEKPPVRIGFAGGLGPNNIEQALDATSALEDFWLDMESGVRTDDRFDLVLVEHVLKKTERAWR